MGWAKALAMAIIALMCAMFANILANGSLMTGLGMDVFLAGLADPWRAFIGFDLMAGLLLMFGWIVFRERGSRPLDTAAWVLTGLWWGNIVVAAYILHALRQAGGDPARFFLGRRAGALAALPRLSGLIRMLSLAAAAATALYALDAMRALAFEGLAAWAFIPAFGPIVLAFVLLAFPATVQRESKLIHNRVGP